MKCGQTRLESLNAKSGKIIIGNNRAGIRQLVLEDDLLRMDSSADNTTLVQQVTNPSSRLNLIYEVFYEPDAAANEVADWNSSTWVITGATRGAKFSGVPLQRIDPPADISTVTTRALPRAYEFSSGIGIIDVALTLNIPQDSGAADEPGWWRVRAMWEPNVPVPDEELVELFNRCQLGSAG